MENKLAQVKYVMTAFNSKWKYEKHISRRRSRSPDYAELAHITLLFRRERQRNVLRFMTHVHMFSSFNVLLCYALVAVVVMVC